MDWRQSWPPLVLCWFGCASNTSTTVPRHGAEVEPRTAFVQQQPAPEAEPFANASDPVVTLRTPHSRAEAVEVLNAYFTAVARESRSELSKLFTEDTTMHYGPHTSAGLAIVAWVRRFAQRDYLGIQPASVYDAAGLELRSARDVEQRAHLGDVAFVPGGAELALRVPLNPNVGKNRFGDELQLLLVPSERGLLIQKIMETGYVEP